MVEAYPLHWPFGYERTESYKRKKSAFMQTMEKAQGFLRDEISRLGASNLVVSANIPVRRDGMLYADYMTRKIDDPGVAIYFRHKGKDIAMCCDKYLRVWENIYALGKGIEAIRGLERWGVSDFLNRIFTGFTALPETTDQKTIWEILGLSSMPASSAMVHSAYKIRAKELHPDAGGSVAEFQKLQDAYKNALLQYEH